MADERRAALMRTAARVIPVIVEMILESGEEPTEALVTRCMVEYQTQLRHFFVAYCDESDLREEVKLDILRAAYQRIREAQQVAS